MLPIGSAAHVLLSEDLGDLDLVGRSEFPDGFFLPFEAITFNLPLAADSA